MTKDYIILLVLVGIALASCYCPRQKIHATGPCTFRITCINIIRGIRLPGQCLESTNYPVTVKVTLNDAIDKYDDNVDISFLATITHLKLTGSWKETTLPLLQYTTKLQTLTLANMGLEEISGTPFLYLSLLEELNLSKNKLTEIDGLFEFAIQPNKLKILSLAYNAIEEVSGLAFEELSSLKELDLSYNIISDLTEEPFFNLTSLEVLRLNNNRIKDLNGALNSLHSLKHLYVKENRIQNIDDKSLDIIEHLETFDVSWNDLEQIKPTMFLRHWQHLGNHSYCKIILSGNHIASIPNGTVKEISSRYARNSDKYSINVLTELDISENSITSIEYNAFQSLFRVVSLNLSKNKIIDFIVNANDLADVKYLNLSSNYISHLYYESFSFMNNLQNLDLSYNRLDFIPDMTFNNVNNLKLVNMTYNEIEKLDSIHITIFHPEGGVLDLSNNGLFKLKIPCADGARLMTLYLRSNVISDSSLIDLAQQTELVTVDMSKNIIENLDVSSLLLPKSLVFLDLSCNKIQSIGPSTFHGLNRLKTLRLGHNQLTEIEYGSFVGLLGLQNLDLSFNHIGFLDSKLMMDLKHLQFLSLRSNSMNYLDCKSWYSHKIELTVFIDNNNLTCDWLGNVLSDYNNGYTKMRPAVLVDSKDDNSVEGIPCVADDSAAFTDVSSKYVMADDRLLITSQKILEAVREQNRFLGKIIWTLHENSEKAKKDS